MNNLQYLHNPKQEIALYVLPQGHRIDDLNRFCQAIINIRFEDLSDRGKESCFCIYLIMKQEHPDCDIRDLAYHTSMKVATRHNQEKEVEFYLK